MFCLRKLENKLELLTKFKSSYCFYYIVFSFSKVEAQYLYKQLSFEDKIVLAPAIGSFNPLSRK